MTNSITSDRLLIRWVSLTDAPFIYELVNSEAWLANIGDRGIKSIADAEEAIKAKYHKAYQDHGTGPYLVLTKENHVPMGLTGIYRRPGLDIPDVGFAFLSKFWGNGYAFEATVALLEEANHENITDFSAIALPSNLASIRLLEKLGFAYIKSVVLPGETVSLNYYERSKGSQI